MDFSHFRPLIALFTLICAAASVAQQVYRWTDEDGTVHFSATPPPGVEAPPAMQAPVPTYNNISVAPASAPATADEQDPAEAIAEPEPEPVSTIDMARCQQVREDLMRFGDNPRLVSVDPETGERTVLSFEQREAAIQELMAIRDRVCP